MKKYYAGHKFTINNEEFFLVLNGTASNMMFVVDEQYKIVLDFFIGNMRSYLTEEEFNKIEKHLKEEY